MNNKKIKLSEEAVIKFFLPWSFKSQLQRVADERGVSLSALLRLIITDYLRAKR